MRKADLRDAVTTARETFLAARNVAAFKVLGRNKTTTRGTKMAIFKPDRLGDFVLALGALRTLVEHFTPAECVLFISPMVEELARREFPGVTIVTLPPFQGKLWSGWASFRSKPIDPLWIHAFDTVICLRHQRSAWQDMLLSRFRCRQRLALVNRDAENPPLERRFIKAPLSRVIPAPMVAGPSQCLEFESHRVLLEAVLNRAVTPNSIVPRLSQAEGTRTNGSILICPFGSAPVRTIPAGLLAEGLRPFINHHPRPLRMAVPPNEEARYRNYADTLEKAGLPQPQLVLTRTLAELLSEIAAAAILVATESAPAHIAIALDKSTVAVLGGGHFGMFAPWQRSSKQAWLSHPVSCYHCNWKCPLPEPICITGITGTQVASALGSVA